MRPVLLLIAALSLTACATASSQFVPSTTPTTSQPSSTPTSATTPGPFPVPHVAHQFAYVQLDGTLWLVNADSASRVELVSGLTEVLKGDHFLFPWQTLIEGLWSPNGRYLVYYTPQGALEALDLDSGEHRTLDDGSDGAVTYVESISDDTIVYTKAVTNSSGQSTAVETSVTFEGRRGAVPEPNVVPGLDCEYVDPLNGAVLCLGKPADDPGIGRQLYLSWPGNDIQLLSENAETLGADTWSPDHRWLAYFDNARGGSTMTGEVHILNPETGKNVDLGTFTTDQNAGWAPSQDRLIFYNLEIDSDTGAVTKLFGEPSSSISWSPDLSKVAFVEGDIWGKGTLVALDLASGKRTQLLTINTTLPHAGVPGLGGTWSPDGRYLSFFGTTDGTNDSAEVYLFDSETGSITPVASDHPHSGDVVSYSPDWTRLLLGKETADIGKMTITIANPDGSSPIVIGDGTPLRQPWRPFASQ